MKVSMTLRIALAIVAVLFILIPLISAAQTGMP